MAMTPTPPGDPLKFDSPPSTGTYHSRATPLPAAPPRKITDDERATLDWFASLSDDAKVGLLQKVMQRFTPPTTGGEVLIGASAPEVIPPSGEIDPVTGAPVKPEPEPAPQPGVVSPGPMFPPPGPPPPPAGAQPVPPPPPPAPPRR